MNREPIDRKKVWIEILEAMANGASMSSVLKREGMPDYSWCTKQIRDDPELQRAYNQALENRGALLAEQIFELADQPMPKGLDPRELSAWVQKLKLQVDARRWASSRLLPKVYGDRLDMSVTTTSISITQALQEADKRLVSMEARIVSEFKELPIASEYAQSGVV
jgi:hypothetical protein